MGEQQFESQLTKEIAKLIPAFLDNRKKDIEALRAALENGDLNQVRQIGHRMKGSGSAYGFPAITDFGRRIENAATTGEATLVAELMDEYGVYVAAISKPQP